MNATPISTDFWEDLLDAIDQGKVIPIIGSGAVTMGGDQQPLYPWLARRLAEQLNVPLDNPDNTKLSAVATSHMLNGGDPKALYTKINRILKNECPAPGQALLDLASIATFSLYLSATFDPLLERALDTVRNGSRPETKVQIFSPLLPVEDLPVPCRDLAGTHVFHLLGRYSPSPEYVITDEDFLEFIFGLKDSMNRNLERLARELKQNNLLFIGLDLSDWLARFFLRLTKQERLSSRQEYRSYLAEGPTIHTPDSLDVFFRSVSRDIHVVHQDSVAFCAELARRWKDRHPAAAASSPRPAHLAPVEPEIPYGAIFISYAREDEAAVVLIVQELRAAGCIVWYDRERLKGGQNWHNVLDDAVKRRCGLFLSVISTVTAKAREGYFVMERNWAAARAERFVQGEEFYLPVIIDDTPSSGGREPKAFAHIQTTRAAGGSISAAYASQVYELQRKVMAAPR